MIFSILRPGRPGFAILAALYFLGVSSTGALFADPSTPEQPAAELVGVFRDAVYMQQEDDDVLYRRFRILRADLGDLPLDERSDLFWRAQATYYMGRAFQSLDSIDDVLAQDSNVRKGKFKSLQRSYTRLDEVVAHYEEALGLMEQYLERGRDARGVRLYTECLSQLSTLKSLGYLMAHGPDVEPLAEEAVSLDSNEIKAHLLLASRYVYSPAIWGGDPDKGIAMLEDIRRIGGLDKEDHHNIAIAIGFAHTMAERWGQAIPFFARALEVYPTNVYAQAMIRLCGNEVKK